MQTIIGSGGAIGIPLAKELKRYTDKIRLVSRAPEKVNDTDELMTLDLSVPANLDQAVEGSEIVYVTIGFPYSTNVWQATWPPFIDAVIAACERHKAKLVFFDNVYMYAKSAIPHMTEDSPMDPPSRKGAVRRQLHEKIMGEVRAGNLQALIARSADFYGPDTSTSVLGETVVKNMLLGKKAQVFGDLGRVHTYTYTPDAGKATAQLGNTPDAYGQVWHLPTTSERLTNQQWIQLVEEELKTKAKVQMVPAWMMKVLGIFVPIMREFPEMMYQNELDYFFDSSKFEKRFGWKATLPREGIHNMVVDLRKKLKKA